MTTPQFFAAADGVRLAWRELGAGRPVLMLHGFCSDAQTNWISYGTAAQLAETGFRCIMPDLRGHGASDKPYDPASYPPDILARDAMALAAHLDLIDYDLVGYSLGARTAVRMLVLGATPSRVILSGMGLEGLVHTNRRSDYFRAILRNLDGQTKGSGEWLAAQFIKGNGADASALLGVLDSVVETPHAAIEALNLPVGVICGAQDGDNGSAAALAAALPNARYIEVPGNHMSAVTKPDLAAAMIDFLAA